MAPTSFEKPTASVSAGKQLPETAGVGNTAVTSVGVAEGRGANHPGGHRAGRRAGDVDGERQAGPRRSNRASRCSTRCAIARISPKQARVRSRRLRCLHVIVAAAPSIPVPPSPSRCRASRFAPSTVSPTATLHPVQQAFVDTDGLMCGFCTPGFVMATVALLERTRTRHSNRRRRGSTATSAAAGPSSASWKRP